MKVAVTIALTPAPRKRERGFWVAGSMYCRQDAFEITGDLLVGEAYDSVALRFQYLGAESVGFNLLKVEAAVDFDHQARGGAVKVHDESADGVLAAEFEAR